MISIIKLVVVWLSFLLIFTGAKALILLDSPACNGDSGAEFDVGGDKCITEVMPTYPDISFDVFSEVGWNPQYVNLTEDSNGCSGWQFVNPFCHLKSGTSAVGNAILNLVIVINEMGSVLFEVIKGQLTLVLNVLEIVGFLIQFQAFIWYLAIYTIPGAAWYVNMAFATPLFIGTVFVGLAVVRWFIPLYSES